MARARNIKPGFFRNAELMELDPLARLLFIGLWCLADKAGRLPDRPKHIKFELLTCDACDCDALLQLLHDAGFILRYAVDDVRYIQVVNFAKHQNPHYKEAESDIPPPPGVCDDPMPQPEPPSVRETTLEEPARERPHLTRFLGEVWTPHFPHAPLVPAPHAIDGAKLDRLERALADGVRQAGGIEACFRVLRDRLGAGALRAKLQDEIGEGRPQWQQRMVPYLAASIETLARELASGEHDRPAHTRPRTSGIPGTIYPRPPADFTGVRCGIRGLSPGLEWEEDTQAVTSP